ncbi:epimerase [Microbacterium sp. ZW T2_14]|uniref:epimerase n=1 Tax=Microbacterium sp. ZW T2_14 TaxID=3378079 RepID=UPI0038538DDE
MSRPLAVIGGASGFVGRALVRAFTDDGYDVRTIGRADADAQWTDADDILTLVDGAAVVVNLAGRSVNCRYTDANRDEILSSRVETTRVLHRAIAAAATPPPLWLNASTATIYRYALDRPQTERDGELGAGFSVDVARAWEDEFFAGDLPSTRRVALRMAIVLGDGPATRTLVRLARLGLGGTQYDGWWFPHRRYRGIGPHPTGDGRPPWHRSGGRQRFSWIHLDDVVGAVRFVRDDPGMSGPVNLAAPGTSDNRELMATLRRLVGAPIGLPAWRFMLEPAMWALRTEPELVLKSRWAIPEALTAAGYVFAYPQLEPALDDVVAALGRRPS